MIPRYSRPEMVAIWSPETRFRIWFEIEAHACDALAEIGVIPKEAARTIWEKGGAAKFDVERIDEIERVTKHDVIAFLTHVAEIVGPEARYLHQGLTSSDVLDTCFSVQLTRAADLLMADIDALLDALRRRALEHKHTLCIGRSHGIHAEPTTFGLKMAYAYAEFARGRERLVAARTSCTLKQVSSTSDEVMPWWTKRASGPTCSARLVRKAMTSWRVSRSISSMRSTSKAPRSHTALAASFGMTPSSACASQACASISNQMRNLFSGSQMAVISGRL